ncbi:MAG: hypothetical protein Q8Q36_03210 [bacterium]|nr:hypothetical protein [bacterium]
MQFEKPFEPRFLNVDYLFLQVYEFWEWLYRVADHYLFGGGLPGGAEELSGAAAGISPFLFTLKGVLSIFAIFFITVIIYCSIRLYELRKEEERELSRIVATPPEATPKDDRWPVVEERVNSANPSDWKLAVLEADNMLDDMVRRMGFRGENLGERLMAVEPSDFSSIQSAWEAHKVRNRIAHEGSFVLSQREARRIVNLYEEVFREFHFI